MGLGRRILAFYTDIIVRRPVLSQAVQVCVLMGTGDIISQTAVEKTKFKNLDKFRTMRFAAIGFFIVGPALRVWYGILAKYVGEKGKIVVLKKVALDQFAFAPFFLLSLLTIISFSHGNNWSQVKQELRKNYTDVMITNWCLWPWVQLLNFNFTPLQYQVLVAQTVAIIWNTYLAWKTNRGKPSKPLE